MNYASIEDWFNVFQSCFSNWEAWQRVAGPSTSIATTAVPEMATEGVNMLQQHAPIGDDREANSLMHSWWFSQALKKFRLGCSASADEAYDGFLARNESVVTSIPPRHYRRIRAMLARALPVVDDIHVDGHFGPGAVFEGYDSLEKWRAAPAFSYDIRTMSLAERGRDLDTSCRLHCVPKDFTKHRLITVEGAANSFAQQWTRSYLLNSVHHGSLRRSVMDLGFGVNSDILDSDCADTLLGTVLMPREYRHSEALQQQRAWRASFMKAGPATIDLKDASDSISWESVVEVFPAHIVAYLEWCRSTRLVDPRKPDCRIPLKVYAGMGNATTFVVETLYFWAVLSSICQWLGDNTPVTVFGDDIICGNHAANHPLFEPELKTFGITINRLKSCMSVAPGFRESCGLVAHSGYKFPSLIRVSGFDQQDPASLIALCSMVTALATSPLAGHLALADDLARDLHTNHGVRITRWPLRSATNTIFVPWLQDLMVDDTEVRKHRGRSNGTSFQLMEIRALVSEPLKVHRLRRDLTQVEALGVLSGQLDTLPKSGKNQLSYAIPRRNEVRQRWVLAEC